MHHPSLGVSGSHRAFPGAVRLLAVAGKKLWHTTAACAITAICQIAYRKPPPQGRIGRPSTLVITLGHTLMRWPTRWSLAAAALLAVAACALCVSTYHVFGNFWDEPEHIAAGLVLIDRGEYRYDVQHPPFARLAAAIGPYLAGARFHGEPDPIGDAAGRDLLYHSTASYETLLTLARLGMLPFLLLLLGATFRWLRHWHDPVPALLAVLFLVSCPVI